MESKNRFLHHVQIVLEICSFSILDMALIPEELLPQYKETLPVNSDISFHGKRLIRLNRSETYDKCFRSLTISSFAIGSTEQNQSESELFTGDTSKDNYSR